MAKNNKFDITTSGPLTFKQLQEANLLNFDYNSLSDDMKQAWEEFDRPQPSAADYYSSEPIYARSSTGDFGESMWDPKTIGLEGVNRINDIRSENQWGVAQLGAGVLKAVGLAGTTFVNNTVGLGLGISEFFGQAIKERRPSWDAFSKIYDNEVTKATGQLEEYLEEALPNYMSEAEQATPWYKRMHTMNWIGNTLIKNIGFMVGAFYSGGAWVKALGIASKLLRGGKMLSGIAAQTVGSGVSAAGEAGIEGFHAAHDLINYETTRIDDFIKQKENEIFALDIPREEKIARLNELALQREELIKDVEQRADKIGSQTMLMNLPLLFLSEFFTFGRLYKRGFKPNADLASGIVKNSSRAEVGAAMEAVEKTASRITKEGGKYGWLNATKAEKALAFAKTPIVEGNEEMSQAFISELTTAKWSPDDPNAYYQSIIDGDSNKEVNGWLNSVNKALAKTYGDPNRWEEFAAGFISSALGMPTFGRVKNSGPNTWLGKGKLIGLSGGVFGDIKELNARDEAGRKVVETMNKFLDDYSKQIRYFAQSNAFTDAMNGYAAENNAFQYKNAENNESFAAISSFARAGKLNDLRELVNQDFANLSDDNIISFAKATTPNFVQNENDGTYEKQDEQGNPLKGGWRNQDGSLMSDTPEGRDSMRKTLEDKKKTILKEIDNYNESVQTIRAITNNALNEDAVEELAWLHWKIGKFNDRFGQLKSELSDSGFLRETSSVLLNEREEIERELNNKKEPPTDLEREQLNEAKTVIDKLDEYISILGKSKTALELGENIGINQDFQKVLSNDNVADLIAPKLGLSKTNYKQIMDKLSDAGKLAMSAISFDKRLDEFMKDPLKLAKNRENLSKKEEAKQEEKSSRERRNNASKKSKSELVREAIARNVDLDEVEEDMKKAGDTEGEKHIQQAKEMKSVHEETIKRLEEQIKKIENGIREVGKQIDETEDEKEKENLNAEKIRLTSELTNARNTLAIANKSLDSAETADEMLDEGHIKQAAEKTGSNGSLLTSIAGEIKTKRKEKQSKDDSIPDRASEEPGELEVSGDDGSPTIPAENEGKEELKENSEEKSENKGKEETKKSEDNEQLSDDEIVGIPTGNIEEEQLGESDYSNPQGNIMEVSSTSGLYTYWKPITTKLPIGKLKYTTSTLPFYESLEKEDRKRIFCETLFNFLNDNRAFDAVDNRLVKKDTEIYFGTIESLNQGLKNKVENFDEPVILMFIKDSEGNYQVVGDLPTELDKGLWKRISGYESFREKFINEYNEYKKSNESNESNESKPFILNDITTHVANVAVGHLVYNEDRTKDRTLKEIFGDKTIVIAINDKQGRPKKLSGAVSGVIRVPYNTPGYSYVVAPTNNPSVNYGVPFHLPLFGDSSNPFEDYVKSKLGDLFNRLKGKKLTQKDLLNIKQAINYYFGVFTLNKEKGEFVSDVHINTTSNEKSFTIKISNHGKDYEAAKEISVENGLEDLFKFLEGLQFNVSPALFSDKGYKEALFSTARTNLQEPHTVSGWFTINPIGVDGKEIKASNLQPKSSIGTKASRSKAAVAIDIQRVDFNDHVIIYKGGRREIVTEKSSTELKAKYAQAEAIARNQTEPFESFFGWFDPKTGKFETKPEETTAQPTKESRQEEKQEANKESSIEDTIAQIQKELIDSGELNSENREVWDKLNNEQKKLLSELDKKDRERALEDLVELDEDEFSSNEATKIITGYMETVAVLREKKSTDREKKANLHKEMRWLHKALPQLGTSERVRIVDGLIKISKGDRRAEAYGYFHNGVMTISSEAASGTVFHEAFHAVTRVLLNKEERKELMKEGRKQYKNMSNLEVEENLAEDFRRYIQIEEIPIIGNIAKAFRTIKHIIQGLTGREMYINNLFYRISRGEFANVSAQQEKEDTTISDEMQEIKKYHADKLQFKNLSKEQQRFIEEEVGIENYNAMSNFTKEVTVKCRA